MPGSDVTALSVVVPCYRSATTLRPLVERLRAVLDETVEDYEVILVVDGSPDDTWDVARELAEKHADVTSAIRLMRNYGQHNALLAGIKQARHPVIVTMDDDLQHPPEQIGRLLAPLDDPTVDLVYGVPVAEEHGVLRSLASRTVKAGLSSAGVPNARDVSAFRAFRTQLRDGFVHVADPYASIDVWLSWTTAGVRRESVLMEKRSAGRSNYTPGALVRHAFNMVTGYSEAPLRLVLYLGLLCAALGAVLLGLVITSYALGRTTVAGFTTLAAMVSLFSGAQMLSIGILGEYVGRLHARSMTKPTYLVRSQVSGGREVDASADGSS